MSSAHIIYIAFTLLLGVMVGFYLGRKSNMLSHDDAQRRLRLREQREKNQTADATKK